MKRYKGKNNTLGLSGRSGCSAISHLGLLPEQLEQRKPWSKEKDPKQLVHSLKIILVIGGFVLNNHTEKVLDFHCFR